MLHFTSLFLTAAPLNAPYTESIQATGGVEPYSYVVTSGSLPLGLTLSTSGALSGSATDVGVYNFTVRVTDATSSTREDPIQLAVLNFIDLSDVTVDQGQFVQQFETALAQSGSWSTGLTTQTSQTLIELASAVGTFNTAKIVRALEDAFPETAQSDSALLATANMQGLRLSRKLPATVAVELKSSVTTAISPYTQFSAAGFKWFSTEQISLQANVPLQVILKEGEVHTVNITGRGTDLQAWVSPEDSFKVSDQDVQLAINGTIVHKSYGGLWNFNGMSAWADRTLSDGRLLVQFGSKGYGAVPGINDLIQITYVTTVGSSANSISSASSKMSYEDNVNVTGVVLGSPSGGADERAAIAYKNFSAGTFGTYGSAVTKAQYQSVVNNYPGIVDAVTQAQREINPAALEWMNIIRVSGLTNSPWSQLQIKDFITYVESTTMYSTKFIWQTPVAVPRVVDISVYCFNSVKSTASVAALVEAAITKLFSPRSGLLMTNFYLSDLVETAMNAAPGQISYVEINEPTQAMIVTTPESPYIKYTVQSGGTLTPRLYSYALSVDAPSPADDGSEDIGAPSNWVFPQVTTTGGSVVLDWSGHSVANALRYHVWGRRAGHIGKLVTIYDTTITSYTDLGGADPTVLPVPLLTDTLIRYNSLSSLKVSAFYAGRQTKVTLPIRDVV